MKNLLKMTFAIFLATSLASAYANAEGIQFVKGLSWQQVLDKAKAEHKDIFIDCYATWCGPCKSMDQNVYPQKQVGDIYNEKFISVRLQMDKTRSDSPEVQSWYSTADELSKTFNVSAYPTLLYLDGNGKLLNKSEGGKELKDFIQLAYDARDTTKLYYQSLANKAQTPDDKVAFDFFYNNSKKVDAIMGNDFAESQVRKMIENAEVKPLIIDAKPTGITPNYDSLKTVIAKKYNPTYAESVITTSKYYWYACLIKTPGGEKYEQEYLKAGIDRINLFRLDTVEAYSMIVNNFAWNVFVNVDDKTQLLSAAKWMKTLADKNPKDANELDTYSCLLYRAGETEQAIELQKKSAALYKEQNNSGQVDYANSTIAKMQKGEAIWTEKEYQ